MLYRIHKVEILDENSNSLALEDFSSNFTVRDDIYTLAKEISNHSTNNIIKLNLNKISSDTLADVCDGWAYWNIGKFTVSINIDILEAREIGTVGDILWLV